MRTRKLPFQILEGSHKCGRIDHHPVLNQAEADLQRVEELQKTCPHLYVEMSPGMIARTRTQTEMIKASNLLIVYLAKKI